MNLTWVQGGWMPFHRAHRRETIALLGGAVVWPFAARAQQLNRRIGAVIARLENDPVGQAEIAALFDTGNRHKIAWRGPTRPTGSAPSAFKTRHTEYRCRVVNGLPSMPASKCPLVYFTRRYCRPILNHERAPDLALQTATTESRLGRPKTQIRIIGPLIHGDAIVAPVGVKG
jgi:hypothetical protein